MVKTRTSYNGLSGIQPYQGPFKHLDKGSHLLYVKCQTHQRLFFVEFSGAILKASGVPFFEHQRNRTEKTTFPQGSQICCIASVPGGIRALLRLGNINESFQKYQAKFLLNVQNTGNQ